MRLQIFFSFLLLIVGYHLIHTFLGFGMSWLAPEIISVGKDLLWIVLVIGFLLSNRAGMLTFFRDRKGVLWLLVALLAWALVLSYFEGMSPGSILVGAKYDIYPLVVLVSAIAIGYTVQFKPHPFISSAGKSIMRILLLGIVRQGAKYVLPEFFSRWGYGPVGDYALGSAPPIWYRTGPGGLARLQGLFAGPNNYGFFLVAISGLVTYLLYRRAVDRKAVLLGLVYAGSLFRTLSRGAWIGAAIGAALTIWRYFPHYKKLLYWGAAVGVVALFLVSTLKSGSTAGHRDALWEGLTAFFAQPWGYGLGMAGPSIHYEGVYLPENQYMQLLLDLGIPGLVFWGAILVLVTKKALHWSRNEYGAHILLMRVLMFGIAGLLVEGIFLHVREDSMVNYLVLGTFGILLGVLGNTRHQRT